MKMLRIFVVILNLFICSISWSADDIKTGPLCFEDLDVKPTLLGAIPPKYPLAAKRNSIEGKVVLSFIITTKGTVRNARVVESSPPGVFEESALKAAEKYRFSPGRKDGKPVEACTRMPIVFTMD